MFYDYICDKCGKEKEVNHPITEDPEILCECGAVMKRKITGGAGIHYKGDGWANLENKFRGNAAKAHKSKMTKKVEKIG